MKPKEASWPQYIRNGLGLKLSKLGERLHIDSLTYNAVILELFHSSGLKNAPIVVDAIREVFPEIKSAIDVGCGGGAFAAEFSRAGVRTVGLEHSPHGVKLAREQGVACLSFDVSQPLTQVSEKADLIYSFEVAEHISESLADQFVRLMTNLGALIIFSAAQPNQGGIGHINEQPLSYWIEKFERAKFRFRSDESEKLRHAFRHREAPDWFCNNSCVFRKV